MLTTNKIYGKFRTGNDFFRIQKKKKIIKSAKIRATIPSNETSVWCGLTSELLVSKWNTNSIKSKVTNTYVHGLYIGASFIGLVILLFLSEAIVVESNNIGNTMSSQMNTLYYGIKTVWENTARQLTKSECKMILPIISIQVLAILASSHVCARYDHLLLAS